MRTNNVLCIFLLILVPQCFCAKFSADSFTALGQDLNSEEYFLKEYAIDGTELQTIALSDNLPSLSRGARADSTGALISFVVHNGVYNNYVSKAYTLDLMGQTVSTTSLPGNTAIASDVIVDGQNVWFTTIGGSVPYTTRGTNGAPVTANILPSNMTPRDTIQLVGTRLYTNVGLKLHYMDPISTTESTLSVLSTTTTDSISFFYFHSPSVAYAITTGSTPALIRFDVTGNSATEAYRYTITTLVDSSVINCYSTDVGGYRYVFVAQQAYPFSRITSYVDVGTTFRDENSLFTLSGPTFIVAVGASPKPTCSDDMKNQDETDVDCGGSTCSKCPYNMACLVDSDCSGNDCTELLCAATCSDGSKNQDESDVDCGGVCGDTCAVDKSCNSDNDCASGYCDNANKCKTPTCDDSVKNQNETDVDCGGVCSGCAFDKACLVDQDCLGEKCTTNTCAASCLDGALNQDETDIDCGGNNCDKCTDNKACLSSSDCFTDYCNNALKCALPTCDDNVKNQDESDVDCGGISCIFCGDGRTCLVGSDCSSGYCDANNKCATPTCSDTVKNQDETDVDCGGTLCSVCTGGKSCNINSDCDSNVCTGNECANIPVAPIADTPQSSSPSSTQSPLKPVSAGNNVVLSCYSVVVVLIGFMAFI